MIRTSFIGLSRAQMLQPRVLQHRKLNVHEYCGMEMLSKHGVPVPKNVLCKVRCLRQWRDIPRMIAVD